MKRQSLPAKGRAAVSLVRPSIPVQSDLLWSKTYVWCSEGSWVSQTHAKFMLSCSHVAITYLNAFSLFQPRFARSPMHNRLQSIFEFTMNSLQIDMTADFSSKVGRKPRLTVTADNLKIKSPVGLVYRNSLRKAVKPNLFLKDVLTGFVAAVMEPLKCT